MGAVNTSVIVAGARTPVGRLMGSLSGFSGSELGGIAIKAALAQAGVSGDQVQYVIMGELPFMARVLWASLNRTRDVFELCACPQTYSRQASHRAEHLVAPMTTRRHRLFAPRQRISSGACKESATKLVAPQGVAPKQKPCIQNHWKTTRFRT